MGPKVIIPGVDMIQPSQKYYDEAELTNAHAAVDDGWWTEGRWSKEFSKKIKDFLGVKHCLLTNSGSSANLLAFMALMSPKLGSDALQRGDMVITVAAGFPTTVNPIVQAGCIPLFVDVDFETLNIDVEELEACVVYNPKAIMLAHTLGNPFNLEVVQEFCKKHDLWLIEDCCDALGSKYKDKYCGTFGDLATFSFHPAHHITTGQGGAVVTNNSRLAEIVLSIRDHGRNCWCNVGCDNTCGARFNWQLGDLPYGYDHKYIYDHLGYNLNVTDIQAAIGSAQMDKLEGFIKARRFNYHYLLSKLWLTHPFLFIHDRTIDANPSWFGFAMSINEDRQQFIDYLNANKIGTRLLFAGNITKQPYFKDINYRVVGNLQNTDRVMNETLWIGVHPNLTSTHLDYIIEVINDYFYAP